MTTKRYTAKNATKISITWGADFVTDEPRTFVTVCWGENFNATGFDGHIARTDAIERAVAEMNALHTEAV